VFSQVLSGTELKGFGKWSTGKMRIQTVANMTIVFKYLKSIDTIKLSNIGTSTFSFQGWWVGVYLLLLGELVSFSAIL
jgi:hypothetical protein